MSLLFVKFARTEHKKDRPLFAQLVTPEESLPAVKTIPAPVSPPSRNLRHLAPPITERSPRELSSEQSVRPSGQHTTPLQNPLYSQPGSSQMPGIRGGANEIPSEKGVMPAGKSSPHPIKKENLFDREIIASSAKKAEEEHKNSVSFDTSEFKDYGYMQRLKEKIEGIWKYPYDMASQGIYGDLLIDFTIKKDGSLGNVDLVRTSGHRSLDEAAMRALRDAAPYWPLPDAFKRDAMTISGHFIYLPYGTYLR